MTSPDEIAPQGSRERDSLDRLDLGRLPRHIAIIMDGNGRWARARGLPRVEGHRAGIRAVRQTVETAAKLGIDVVTLYAFSTENWKRPRSEILTLMSLLKEYIDLELETFVRNNLRFCPIGRIDQLDATVRAALRKAVKATSTCDGTTVQIALNYSGRQEITEVVQAAAREAHSGQLTPQQVDESWVSARLFTTSCPDPDLLIRTSGEQRISNFLLWQIAYSEIYFSPVLWPDFDQLELLTALVEFQRRERRFGGLSPSDEGVFSPARGSRDES